MHKKTLALCAALVALAVVPAMASANPTPHLLKADGVTTVAVGASLTAVNTEPVVFTTGSGDLACTKAHMAGKVVANTGKLIEGNIESASFKGEGTEERCKSTLFVFGAEIQFEATLENLPWCLVSRTDGEWSLRGGGCTAATKNLRFTLHHYTHTGYIASCTYERATGTGTNNVGTTPLVLKSGANQTFALVSGGFFCPTIGILHAALRVTEGGNHVMVK